MVNQTSSEGPRFSEPTGAVIKLISSERKMRVYAIPVNELKLISLLNTQAIAFASIGSFLASFIAAILIDAIMEFGALNGLTGAASILVYYFAPMFGFVALAFFGLCTHALVTRHSMLSTIKNESITTDE